MSELDKLYDTAKNALEESRKAVTEFVDAVKNPSADVTVKSDTGEEKLGGKTKKYKLNKKKRRGPTKRKR